MILIQVEIFMAVLTFSYIFIYAPIEFLAVGTFSWVSNAFFINQIVSIFALFANRFIFIGRFVSMTVTNVVIISLLGDWLTLFKNITIVITHTV